MAKRRSTFKKPDRRLLVITSDWHAGHILGLMNPETVLYEQRIDGKGKNKEGVAEDMIGVTMILMEIAVFGLIALMLIIVYDNQRRY